MRRILTWAIVLLVVGASVSYVGITQYQSYNTPLAKCQREAAQGYDLGAPLIISNIYVQFGTDSGVLSVKVDGSGCSAITGLTITSIRPFLSGVVNTSFLEYQGVPVGPSHPVPLNEPSYGSIAVSNVSIGRDYSFSYILTTQDGQFGSSGEITLTARGYTPINYSLDQNLSSASGYLVANYNPELGLIPETPGSPVYWLYSDNYLADLALAQYQGNATMPRVAANISQSIEMYLPVPDVGNQYAVLGSNGVCSFPAALSFTLATVDGAQIMTVKNNGTGVLNTADYADIDFLNAICQYHHNNMTGAILAYDEGMEMFDGAGFRDLPYNQTGQYQTYKVALFLYASATLGQPIDTAALSVLLKLQAPNGGFYTGYDASYSHGTTMTNTETTSLALLALEACENQEP